MPNKSPDLSNQTNKRWWSRIYQGGQISYQWCPQGAPLHFKCRDGEYRESKHPASPVFANFLLQNVTHSLCNVSLFLPLSATLWESLFPPPLFPLHLPRPFPQIHSSQMLRFVSGIQNSWKKEMVTEESSELWIVSRCYRSVVTVLIGRRTRHVIARLSDKSWCYWLWRL